MKNIFKKTQKRFIEVDYSYVEQKVLNRFIDRAQNVLDVPGSAKPFAGTLVNLISKEKIRFHDACIQLNYTPSGKLEEIKNSWCFEVRWGGRKILKNKKKYVGQAYLLLPKDKNFPRRNVLIKNVRFGMNTLLDAVEPKDNFDMFRFAQRMHEKNARKKLKNRKRVSRNIIS